MKTISQRFLLSVCGALFIAGCSTPSGSWEYRTRTTDSPQGKAVLDRYGKSGWELVNYTCRPKDNSGTNFIYQYVFKRPNK
jgi:hypothetical protein